MYVFPSGGTCEQLKLRHFTVRGPYILELDFARFYNENQVGLAKNSYLLSDTLGLS